MLNPEEDKLTNLSLNDKPKAFELFCVLRAGGNEVNSRRFDRAVPENVRQAGDIVARVVEAAGEQVPQIVRKDLARRNVRGFAKGLHLRPNLLA